MKKIIQKVLNTESDGTCMTLTTSHHYAGNITHPRGGYRETGVLVEYRLWYRKSVPIPSAKSSKFAFENKAKNILIK